MSLANTFKIAGFIAFLVVMKAVVVIIRPYIKEIFEPRAACDENEEQVRVLLFI